MNNDIIHLFKTRAHDLEGLFKDVSKFSQFEKNLQIQSKLRPNDYRPNKYLGDGFELFAELFFKLNPINPRTVVCEYKPVLEDDFGVDGEGVNIKGNPIVVQVKYRDNHNHLLTGNGDHLSNFVAEAASTQRILTDKKDISHIVFTTAKGIHKNTVENRFKDAVYCINYKMIKSIVDDNIMFWRYCNDLLTPYYNNNKKND